MYIKRSAFARGRGRGGEGVKKGQTSRLYNLQLMSTKVHITLLQIVGNRKIFLSDLFITESFIFVCCLFN